MRHKIRHSYWKEGRLHIMEKFCAEIEEAFEFIKSISYGSVKIYNTNDELVHDTDVQKIESYA
jgi:hypothetical protein